MFTNLWRVLHTIKTKRAPPHKQTANFSPDGKKYHVDSAAVHRHLHSFSSCRNWTETDAVSWENTVSWLDNCVQDFFRGIFRNCKIGTPMTRGTVLWWSLQINKETAEFFLLFISETAWFSALWCDLILLEALRRAEAARKYFLIYVDWWQMMNLFNLIRL